jgi:hypothetical protein
MRRLLASLVVLFGITTAAQADYATVPTPVPCDCGKVRTGFFSRYKAKYDYHSCGAGRTHHHIGCTGHEAARIFVFGSCCEFFEEHLTRTPSDMHSGWANHRPPHVEYGR